MADSRFPNFSELCTVTRRWLASRRQAAPTESYIALGVDVAQAFAAVRAAHVSSSADAIGPGDLARSLLRSWLTDEQRVDYDQYHFFYVTGSSSGKKYRLRDYASRGESYWYNIDEMADEGTVLARICFGPRVDSAYSFAGWDLPAGDVLLMQKIALETDESVALEIANRCGCRKCIL